MEDFLAKILAGQIQDFILVPLILAYLGGVLTSFSPCIFPMLPVTFAIIAGGKDSKLKPWQTVMFFGLGISLAYVLLGLVAILGGSIFGAWNQSAGIKYFLAGIFLFLGLNTLGIVKLPQFNISKKINNVSWFTTVLLGFFAGFSLSPCTLPVLSVILVYASKQGLVTGLLMLWFYAWGYNTILLLLGFFGNTFRQNLPKNGPWLKTVEKILAVICFAVAVWLVMQGLEY